MTKVIRSWLYCPANRPERAIKALRSQADAVILDLEDSVPASEKARARENLAELISLREEKPVWIRVNALDSSWVADDLDAVATLSVDGVRVPKAEHPKDIAEAAERARKPVALLLESALGVERAFELATCHAQVEGIMLGEGDLASDLHSNDLSWARSRIVVAARAAGLPQPAQSVYGAIQDDDGLRQTSIEARRAGFFGRSVVHPRQIAIVNEVFAPSAQDLTWARSVIAALEIGERDGEGATMTPEGHLLDFAHARRAQQIIDQAAQSN